MKSISFWNMGSKKPFGRVLLSSDESHAIAKYISQLEAEIERLRDDREALHTRWDNALTEIERLREAEEETREELLSWAKALKECPDDKMVDKLRDGIVFEHFARLLEGGEVMKHLPDGTMIAENAYDVEAMMRLRDHEALLRVARAAWKYHLNAEDWVKKDWEVLHEALKEVEDLL